MNPVIGLTGGIGSGKSTVADLFSHLGVTVVDTDRIAHELTGAEGAAMPEIIAAFGKDIALPQGALDRAAMRQRVFTDASAKTRLEAILHPKIRQESRQRCQAATSVYVLLAVPLLVETGVWRQEVRRVLVVDCDEATQIARVKARSALSAAEVLAIMATQATRSERLAVADDVILNNGTPEALEPQVQALHLRYLELFGKG
jgi:dephospho-CoA kinase